MQQDRHDAVSPDALPDDYWQAAARAKTAARTSEASTVACWALVLFGLIVPIFALGASLWALWLAREDSRFVAPALVGFGILAYTFLG